MAVLKVGESEASFDLGSKTDFVLGRHDESGKSAPDIDLEPYGARDKGVSRRHAKLVRLGNGLSYIVDLSSTNGTLVNGKPVEPLEHARLKNGDRIELGDMVLLYFEDQPT
jgi:pSer/pThr/pTyr-binding forkhead associated (FHA) protein